MTMLQHGLVPSTGGYQIERSLRFNSADSAYLSRTPSSSSNRKTWTWSAWVKLSKVDGTWQSLFSAYTTSDAVGDRFEFNYENLGSGPVLYAQLNQSSVTFFVTNAVYRDPSAWYHIVLAVDTTQASASNQFKLYINNVQQTFSSNNGVTQNTDLAVNRNIAHAIGRREKSTTEHFSGYMTEINFVDGSALTPSSFGETDTDTGVWKPKAYSGSYGTNGFYLKFADNSGTTSTTLGKDSSGNGNNWTPNNFSVTAGAGNDSLVDTPTPYGTDTGAGGEVRGNYATANPLIYWDSTAATMTFANGNLDLTVGTSGNFGYAASSVSVSTGKWYFEYYINNLSTGGGIAFINAASVLSVNSATYGIATVSDGWARWGTNVYSNGGTAVTGLTASASTQYQMLALDLDNGKAWFGTSGTWHNSGDPAAGTNATVTFTPGGKNWLLAASGYGSVSSHTGTLNFGARAFQYTAPSGFKALCTQNLPTPTIGATATTRADDYFNTVIWTGNGTSQSITGVGFQPDFIWIKERSAARTHCLTDAVRGFTKYVFSDSTGAEETYSTLVTSADSNGFSLGSSIAVNDSSQTYVGWNWKANGAGSSNTQGTITSTVSANTTAGFSIVTYTGNGTNNATVGHGLGVAPAMIIIKNRDGAYSWAVLHTSVGLTGTTLDGSPEYYMLTLNATDARTDFTNDNIWNPTSTTFKINGAGTGNSVNANGIKYVAYCFAPVAGYSAFGSYTGNGSSDGPFVYTGFRPAWLLLKNRSSVADWVLLDNKRNTYNVANLWLYPNASNAEAVVDSADFLSNGFKLKYPGGTGLNTNGDVYTYACFAENPFKYSLAR